MNCGYSYVRAASLIGSEQGSILCRPLTPRRESSGQIRRVLQPDRAEKMVHSVSRACACLPAHGLSIQRTQVTDHHEDVLECRFADSENGQREGTEDMESRGESPEKEGEEEPEEKRRLMRRSRAAEPITRCRFRYLCRGGAVPPTIRSARCTTLLSRISPFCLAR